MKNLCQEREESEKIEGLSQPPPSLSSKPCSRTLKVLVLSSKVTQSQDFLSIQNHKIKFKISDNLLKGGI